MCKNSALSLTKKQREEKLAKMREFYWGKTDTERWLAVLSFKERSCMKKSLFLSEGKANESL